MHPFYFYEEGSQCVVASLVGVDRDEYFETIKQNKVPDSLDDISHKGEYYICDWNVRNWGIELKKNEDCIITNEIDPPKN